MMVFFARNLRQTVLSDVAVDTISFTPDSKKEGFLNSGMSMSDGQLSGEAMSAEEMSGRSEQEAKMEEKSVAEWTAVTEGMDSPAFQGESQMVGVWCSSYSRRDDQVKVQCSPVTTWSIGSKMLTIDIPFFTLDGKLWAGV